MSSRVQIMDAWILNARYTEKWPTYCQLTDQYSADTRFAPSQWETALLCNDVSHWLGASLISALSIYPDKAWSVITRKAKYQLEFYLRKDIPSVAPRMCYIRASIFWELHRRRLNTIFLNENDNILIGISRTWSIRQISIDSSIGFGFNKIKPLPGPMKKPLPGPMKTHFTRLSWGRSALSIDFCPWLALNWLQSWQEPILGD